MSYVPRYFKVSLAISLGEYSNTKKRERGRILSREVKKQITNLSKSLSKRIQDSSTTYVVSSFTSYVAE
jgi:hypothetical protein